MPSPSWPSLENKANLARSYIIDKCKLLIDNCAARRVEGGMFGHNDSNTQTVNNNQGADAATPAPANPFADTGASAMPSSPAPAAPAAHFDMPSPAPEPPAAVSSPLDTSPDPPAASAATSSGGNDLLDLKQQALHNLQPLVSHLDQSPEEKFKTTMMLIQATDNSALVKEAYEAASQITDEKARAQALLDVVNEINYFTQHDADKAA